MKRFVPIAEYCRRAPWAIRPERVRAWCRDGRRGKRPPYMMIGGRYFIDPRAFDAWLAGKGRTDRERRRERAARKIREILCREG